VHIEIKWRLTKFSVISRHYFRKPPLYRTILCAEKWNGGIGILFKIIFYAVVIIAAIGWLVGNPDSDGVDSNDKRGGIGVVSTSENCEKNWRVCETNEAFVEQNRDG
jgi:hypothetical protein